jgi:hypothetical protein
VKVSSAAPAGSPVTGAVARPFWQQPLIWVLPLQAFLVFWRLDFLDPWTDEGSALDIAALSIREMTRNLAGDFHPPLYYMLGRWWLSVVPFGIPILKLRALSGVWAILATTVLYLCFLRRESPRFQRFVLTLWLLSPCLLLYSRMARSYTMQLTLALLAIHNLLQLRKQAADPARLAAQVVLCIALLYTHYVPGGAIAFATLLLLIWRRQVKAVLVLAGAATVLYAPWLSTLGVAVVRWWGAGNYRVGNLLVDHVVRLGYWLISFSFGETFSFTTGVLAVIAAPFLIWTLWQGWRSRPEWFYWVGIAVVVCYVGVSHLMGYPFTPSHILFALPFFLMLLASGADRNPRVMRRLLPLMTLAYLSGIYDYFNGNGFLNKGYAMPNQVIAATIRSGGENAVVVLDSSFPPPLERRLQPLPIINFYGEESVVEARREMARANGPLWFCHRTHDTSADGSISRFERELSGAPDVERYGFAPYSLIERWVLRWLRGPGQPDHSYECLKVPAST